MQATVKEMSRDGIVPYASMNGSPLVSTSPSSTHAMNELKLSNSRVADVCSPLSLLCFPFAMFTTQANQHAVIIHYGTPTEVVTEPGCHYANCCGREILYLSTAQTSHDMVQQKIIDRNGNPLLVSAVVSYRFTDALSALLQVDNAHRFVADQSTAALKLVVGKFTYDELKLEAEHISQEMVNVLQPRVSIAGAVISNVTLNELNYAPEIAAAMLKKQQASALVEARHLIVQGAVAICQEAVNSLEAGGMQMTHEEKVHIVTNLLTVTTGDRDASPVISL